MGKVIAVANQKGGVAKTTTTSALAAILKRKGYSVLVVDLDPQANLSDSVAEEAEVGQSTYNLLKGETSAKDIVKHLDCFDLLPSNIELAAAEQEISMGKEFRLKEALSSIQAEYDYIIIDTPPSLSVLTVNAFVASQDVIIPTTASKFAATGLYKLSDVIKSVQQYYNPGIRIRGILMTRYTPRSNVSKALREVTETLGNVLGTTVYKTCIRQSVAVEESQANQTDLPSYSQNASPTLDYEAFTDEFLAQEGAFEHGR